MSHRQPHEPEERKSNQVLAKIQHSEASHDEEAPKDHAALVADPKKRLVDGAVDPQRPWRGDRPQADRRGRDAPGRAAHVRVVGGNLRRQQDQ